VRPHSAARDPWFWSFVAGAVVATAYAAFPARLGAQASTVSMQPAQRVRAWARSAGAPFAVGVVLMVVGGVGLRRRRRRRDTAPPESEGGEAGARGAASRRARVGLDRIRKQIADLAALQSDRERQAIAERLDAVLETDLGSLFALRDALTEEMGARRYAVFIGYVSSVERNLARAWSANIDGAEDESSRSLQRALVAVGEALGELPAGPGAAAAAS